MSCLLVIAHPLPGSLTHALADHARQRLQKGGHSVRALDLYADGFEPALAAAERASYYAPVHHPTVAGASLSALQEAEALVLCFPTWWFGPPAMLKGWIDRVWAPGVAYDHAPDLGAIRPRLTRLRHALAVTTLGSPWWVDRLVMHQPVKRMLGTALLRTCAPQCRFRQLSLYKAEAATPASVDRLRQRMDRALAAWR